MRQLKFRAWDNKSKKMSYPFFLNHNSVIFDESDIIRLQELGGLEVTQYLNQKDKNDKEIYEGDIVKFSENIAVVKYSAESMHYEFDTDDANFHSFSFDLEPSEVEIIGNIFENPELLKSI